MTTISKNLVVRYTKQQMYDLVNDIERYPDFLPWCSGAQVHSKGENELKASIHLVKGPVKYSITTVNNMQPHDLISMEYIAGPFRRCAGTWRFLALQNSPGCQINFDMEYEFTNRLIGMTIEPVFNPIADTLIDAFHKRAAQIYAD